MYKYRIIVALAVLLLTACGPELTPSTSEVPQALTATNDVGN